MDEPEQLKVKRLFWAGPLTVIGSVVTVLFIRMIAVAILKPGPKFVPLMVGITVLIYLTQPVCYALTDDGRSGARKERLHLILDRIETIHRNTEDAANIAFATRSALSATLKESNPELERKFQDWIDRYRPIASRHGVDAELQEIRRQLAQLPPR